MAGDSVGKPAAGPRAGLFLHGSRVCALHHALTNTGASLSAMRTRRGNRELVRQPYLGRIAQTTRRSTQASGRKDAAEGCYAHAQLRCRANAIWPAVSGG